MTLRTVFEVLAFLPPMKGRKALGVCDKGVLLGERKRQG